MATAKLLTGTIPALVTPFLEGGGINVEAVNQLVEYHLNAKVSGFYLCGNTGEGFAQTIEERKAMVEATATALQNKVPCCVHVGATTVENACDLARHAKENGMECLSSVVPTDKPRDLAAAVEYFTAVAGATDLPFYIYWVAANADKSVTPEQYWTAVKDIPNLAGLKFTDTNFFTFQQLCIQSGKTLNALTGPDEMAVAGLIMGSDGAIGSTYNVQPMLNVQMHAAFHAGDIKTAMELQEKLNATIALLITHCNCAERGTNIIAGLKAWYRSIGIAVGYPKEQAATPLTAEVEKSLIDGINALGWKVE